MPACAVTVGVVGDGVGEDHQAILGTLPAGSSVLICEADRDGIVGNELPRPCPDVRATEGQPRSLVVLDSAAARAGGISETLISLRVITLAMSIFEEFGRNVTNVH